jgi:hypothetical protein
MQVRFGRWGVGVRSLLGSFCTASPAGAYRFKINVTVSWFEDSRTAWSPRREVMEPRTRTVEAEGREAGEKAGRWDGRMRGVARDILGCWFVCRN